MNLKRIIMLVMVLLVSASFAGELKVFNRDYKGISAIKAIIYTKAKSLSISTLRRRPTRLQTS